VLFILRVTDKPSMLIIIMLRVSYTEFDSLAHRLIVVMLDVVMPASLELILGAKSVVMLQELITCPIIISNRLDFKKCFLFLKKSEI